MKDKKRKKACLARRITGDILIILTVLLAADVVIVMTRRINMVVLKADYQQVFKYQLVICAILFIFALDVRFGIFSWLKNKFTRMIGWILRAVITIMAAVIIFFCCRVIVGSMINTSGPAQYAIVLGMALENGEPTNDLLSRLDTAEKYLDQNSDAVLILTGGNADGSGRTEADVMHDILAQNGVTEENMHLEDQAASTIENFENTVQMVDPDEPIVLISSNYHMARAVKIAGNSGFKKILRLPAPSEFLTYGANMLSEVVLELNSLTKSKPVKAQPEDGQPG